MAEEEFSLANSCGPPSSPGTGSCVDRNCHFLTSNWKQNNFKMEFCSTSVSNGGDGIQKQLAKLTNYRTDMTTFTGQDMRKLLRNRMISHQRNGDSVWSPQGGGEENREDRLKVLRTRQLTQGETGGLERRLNALTDKQINTVTLNWDIQSITHSAQLVQHTNTQIQWNRLPERQTNPKQQNC